MPAIKKPSWQYEPPPDPNNPSKSQIKRDYLALQELAMKLINVRQARLDVIEMDDRLRDAIDELRRFKHLPARARQAQYVGKLLRDENLEPFRRALLP
jgi:ribosome-associated protein